MYRIYHVSVVVESILLIKSRIKTLFPGEKTERFRLERFHASRVNVKRFKMVPGGNHYGGNVHSVTKSSSLRHLARVTINIVLLLLLPISLTLAKKYNS